MNLSFPADLRQLKQQRLVGSEDGTFLLCPPESGGLVGILAGIHAVLHKEYLIAVSAQVDDGLQGAHVGFDAADDDGSFRAGSDHSFPGWRRSASN